MASTTKRNNVLFLVPLALAALASSGCDCGGLENWQFTLKSQNDTAVIDMDGVTLLFEGVPMVLPQGQTGGGAPGSVVRAFR